MNTITLYKVEWCYGSNLQPYFKSTASRDSYFEDQERKKVNLDSPNIKIDFNFEISLKVNVDITEMENFNFAIISYNDKKYYADILESAHISIGYSRVELHRNILCERPDYLSYFEKFLVGKATFTHLNYGRNSQYFLPTGIRYTKEFEYMEMVHTSFDGIKTYEYSYRPMLVIFFNGMEELPASGVNLYGEYTQHGMLIIPLPLGNLDNYAIRNMYDTGYTYSGAPNIDVSRLTDVLNKLSPYIISMHYLVYPMPTVYTTVKYLGVEYTGYFHIVPGIGINSGFLYSPTMLKAFFSVFYTSLPEFNNINSDTFTYEYIGDMDNLLDQIELRFYNIENSIKLDLHRFTNGKSIGFKVYINYIFNINTTEICVKIEPTVAGVEALTPFALNYTFPLQDNTHFTVDQQNLWNSENRYYEALTRNSMSHTATAGKIQARENFAVGASQILTGVVAGGSGMSGMALGQVGMGIGNIIRGVSEIDKTNNDTKHYKEERRLLGLQEQEKPSKTTSGNSAAIRAFVQNGLNCVVYYKPFIEDYKYFISELLVYGVSCFIERQLIDKDTIKEFVNDQQFFIQAEATKKKNVKISTREYNEMLKILNGGCRYFIV